MTVGSTRFFDDFEQGFVWYAIGEWEPNNTKYDLGRRNVDELFNDGDLTGTPFDSGAVPFGGIFF